VNTNESWLIHHQTHHYRLFQPGQAMALIILLYFAFLLSSVNAELNYTVFHGSAVTMGVEGEISQDSPFLLRETLDESTKWGFSVVLPGQASCLAFYSGLGRQRLLQRARVRVHHRQPAGSQQRCHENPGEPG
jgi:hypothetical protein